MKEEKYRSILKEYPVLETPRLLLRPITMEDLDDVYAMGRHPKALEYLIWEGFSSEADAVFAINGFYLSCPAFYGIEPKEEGRIVGNIDVRLTPAHEKGSFGYLSHPDVWGKGYMTEALLAVLSLCFERVGLHRMESHFFPENPASGRVMEKAGMYYEGTMIDDILVRGRFQTQIQYAVTRERWLAEHPEQYFIPR